jgi:hypothetical protein
VPRGREARSCRGGERSSFSAGAHGGGTHLWSSWERITLRGATREPWASAVARLCVRAGRAHPVRAQRARGFRLSHAVRRTTKEVCGTGSRRGLARRKAKRTLARVGPVPRFTLLRKRDRAARQPGKAKALGGSSPPNAARGHDAARGGARASSYCRSRQTPSGSEKRAIGSSRVESPPAIRSA